MSTAPLTPGLFDPILGSQIVFRDMLDAMAGPGTIRRIGDEICGTPDELSRATAACLLTLVDYDTPVWLDTDFAAIRSWLAFHTGAPMAASPRDARFAVMSGQSHSPALTEFPRGDDRYPDLSATVIVVCTSLNEGRAVRLTGPGIESETVIAPQGLHDQFWTNYRENNAHFPLGCDVILVAGEQFLALPRSVHSVEIG